MKFPCLFGQCTIAQRLILLNIVTAVLIIALVGIYSVQVVSLENKLVTMEEVDDVFNRILELRRYEKNILLHLSKDSVSKAAATLDELEMTFGKLSGDLTTFEAKAVFRELLSGFRKYRHIFNEWCKVNSCASEPGEGEQALLIRKQGRFLVSEASSLVSMIRRNISEGFKEILFWLTFVPAVLFIIGSTLFFTQTKNILNRLSSLQQATRDLAAGEFKPIPAPETADEITALIQNFNDMVQALEEKQEQLIQSKKMASIGTFSSGIAHEINNPLNNISLSTDTLLEEFDTMDKEEIREILEDIMEQTERASKIVRNLLDFSRAQATEEEPIYLDYVLHKTLELIGNELRINKIALHKEFPESIPLIRGDLRKLQQVFLNLIINAEQAIGQYGSITVRVQTTDSGFIRTDIIDTGPGISQENIDKIFDPFFTTKEAGKGTGLGLAIVYGIVKKHGGYIEVASEQGKGTTFSVYLPIHREDEEAGKNRQA